MWIDALYIIQSCDEDDDISRQQSEQDWSIESALMDRIYEDAFLVLAGVDSSNSDVGLLFKKCRFGSTPSFRPSWMPFDAAKLPPISKDHAVLSSHGSIPPLHWSVQQGEAFDSSNVMSSPWRSRAWTLQEEVLSQRIIYCSFDQFYWSCRSRFWTESGQNREVTHDLRLPDIPRLNCRYFEGLERGLSDDYDWWFRHQIDNGDQSKAIAFDAWYRLVSNYSARKLSYPSDKLHAIYGLAKQHARHFFNDSLKYYTWGTWSQDLKFGLMWRHHDQLVGHSGSMVYREARNNETNIRAPSWSWASVDTTLEWNLKIRIDPHFNILPSNDSLKNSRPGWSLAISGLSLSWVDYIPDTTDIIKDGSVHGHGTLSYNTHVFKNCEQWLESAVRIRMPYWLLYCHPAEYAHGVSGIFCLILQRKQESTGLVYYRNGWCHLPGTIEDYDFKPDDLVLY